MLCLFESGLWCESAGEKSITHEFALKVDSYATWANPRQARFFFTLFKFQSRNALVSLVGPAVTSQKCGALAFSGFLQEKWVSWLLAFLAALADS